MSWLTADDGAIVLRAFDVDRDDWRSFLLTGIINALAIEEPEVPDPAEAEEPEDAPPF
jgi:predicted DNA-binding transcriptional regulator YafY